MIQIRRMQNNEESNEDRMFLDLNEYEFYYFMPNSESVKNELGYFIKNKSIETYSYVTPTLYGEKNFFKFLNFSFSFFSDGKEYFIIKHYVDDFFQTNSKILRQKNFIVFYQDISLMIWKKSDTSSLNPNNLLELELLSSKNLSKWVDVFFDSFSYPKHLRKYISQMVTTQIENQVEFYIGYVDGKDVGCFCTYKNLPFHGFYGVGTRHRYRRRGYAKIMMSNYMNSVLADNPSANFCLQVQRGSAAEQLYQNLGFKNLFYQKRFDWDPSQSSPLFDI